MYGALLIHEYFSVVVFLFYLGKQSNYLIYEYFVNLTLFKTHLVKQDDSKPILM